MQHCSHCTSVEQCRRDTPEQRLLRREGFTRWKCKLTVPSQDHTCWHWPPMSATLLLSPSSSSAPVSGPTPLVESAGIGLKKCVRVQITLPKKASGLP